MYINNEKNYNLQYEYNSTINTDKTIKRSKRYKMKQIQ